MIQAVLRHGQIQPLNPLPSEWDEGQTLTIESAIALASEFDRLASIWKAETHYLSSSTDIALHSAYQRIIGMGFGVVPLILADLRQQPCQWFWALRSLTGEDPVPADLRGYSYTATS